MQGKTNGGRVFLDYSRSAAKAVFFDFDTAVTAAKKRSQDTYAHTRSSSLAQPFHRQCTVLHLGTLHQSTSERAHSILPGGHR
jgi:hypothetical protein